MSNWEVTCKSFRLLTGLEKVEVGDGCFSQASGGVFELVNCPRLRSVRIGDGSFVKAVRAVFESGCGMER